MFRHAWIVQVSLFLGFATWMDEDYIGRVWALVFEKLKIYACRLLLVYTCMCENCILCRCREWVGVVMPFWLAFGQHGVHLCITVVYGKNGWSNIKTNMWLWWKKKVLTLLNPILLLRMYMCEWDYVINLNHPLLDVKYTCLNLYLLHKFWNIMEAQRFVQYIFFFDHLKRTEKNNSSRNKVVQVFLYQRVVQDDSFHFILNSFHC